MSFARDAPEPDRTRHLERFVGALAAMRVEFVVTLEHHTRRWIEGRRVVVYHPTHAHAVLIFPNRVPQHVVRSLWAAVTSHQKRSGVHLELPREQPSATLSYACKFCASAEVAKARSYASAELAPLLGLDPVQPMPWGALVTDGRECAAERCSRRITGRVDKRYCGATCRQRAHRKSKQAGRHRRRTGNLPGTSCTYRDAIR